MSILHQKAVLERRGFRPKIYGEHQKEEFIEDKDKNYFHSEFHYGQFHRVVPLPVSIQTDKIKSDFRHGIVTLTMPKVKNAPKKVVKVNLADS